MDATLTEILRALYEAHQTIDMLRARNAELERAQQLAAIANPVAHELPQEGTP